MADLPVRNVYDSGPDLTLRLAICAGALLVGAWLAWQTFQSDPGFALIGTAIAVAMVLWGQSLLTRLSRLGQPVVVVDTRGILDRRIAAEAIPWSLVDLVTPITTRYGVRGAFLVMQAGALKAIRMAPLDRLSQKMDAMIALSTGLRVPSAGTQLTGQALHELCLAYSRSHKEVQEETANV